MTRARHLTQAAGALAVAAAAAWPTGAQATCYFVYSARNELVYRSVLPPVDLSKPISQGMRGRFAGGHLTIVPDAEDCIELAAYGPSQDAIAANAAAGRNLSPIEASPLFRNIESRSAFGSDAYVSQPSSRTDAAAPRR